MASSNEGQVTAEAGPVDGGIAKQTTSRKGLPLARVKKIAKMDEDVIAISNSAALIISGATEKFAAYFAEQSFFFTLAEKKKSLNYKHCSSAVARLPQLDFLADVVPQTVKFSETVHGKKMSAQKPSNGDATSSTIPEWARKQPDDLPPSNGNGGDVAALETTEEHIPNQNDTHKVADFSDTAVNGVEPVGITDDPANLNDAEMSEA